ncbi:hypothetical protein LCM23_12860 [Cytobacillus kochii]|uniref:hypothetical protein n=1 Tax=Cytobacillus kochii TaxID=859143 RepID=UPI001CD6E721|nr:hypothetical protein [Cytobacillus kochii]MCA1026984.1 hypothetical protein [Cytobacillus kochii]
MKDFDIWCEGYRATGQSGGATLLGHCTGKDLKEACENLAKKDEGFACYFNSEMMTFWGYRIFDNSADARRSFG